MKNLLWCHECTFHQMSWQRNEPALVVKPTPLKLPSTHPILDICFAFLAAKFQRAFNCIQKCMISAPWCLRGQLHCGGHNRQSTGYALLPDQNNSSTKLSQGSSQGSKQEKSPTMDHVSRSLTAPKPAILTTARGSETKERAGNFSLAPGVHFSPNVLAKRRTSPRRQASFSHTLQDTSNFGDMSPISSSKSPKSFQLHSTVDDPFARLLVSMMIRPRTSLHLQRPKLISMRCST